MVELRLADFSDRNCFADFLNRRGLTGVAVEIGTHRADWARLFLAVWRGELLWCVDHWRPYDPMDVASLGDREADMAQAKAWLLPHTKAGRCEVLRKASLEAAEAARREFCRRVPALDFVYVDGCHQTKDVLDDLEAWWPLLKPGGVLAGHDVLCPGEVAGGWGPLVQRAVFQFADRRGLPVWLVPDAGSPWSYYLEKP